MRDYLQEYGLLTNGYTEENLSFPKEPLTGYRYLERHETSFEYSLPPSAATIICL